MHKIETLGKIIVGTIETMAVNSMCAIQLTVWLGLKQRRCSGMEELTHIDLMLLLFVGYCVKINFGLWVLQNDL